MRSALGLEGAAWLAVPGLVALVAEPLMWLWRSWWDPSYQSDGAIVALALVGLFGASLWSGAAVPDPHARRAAWRLLLLTAAIRLAGRLLAVRNLIDNAVRHGAGRPVEVNAERRAGRLHIRVRDHGAGINATNRDRIFDRFFTTERDHGGTGLGLPIARAVAERRGGRLDLESSPGGTCFELVV